MSAANWLIASRVEDLDRRCVRCGYSLRGLASKRCPECGLEFDPDAPPPPPVPWLRRKNTGWVRAYYQTIWLVVARPRTFANHAWHYGEVEPKDGESFRRLTVILAALSAATFVALLNFDGDHLLDARLAQAARDFVIVLATALTFLSIATLRVPIQLPHVRAAGVERRFSFLQKFCCAGLGIAPVVPLVTMLAICPFAEAVRVWLMMMAGIALIALPVLWCGGCAMLLIFGGRVTFARFVEYGFISALLWVAALAVAIGVGFLVSWAAGLLPI
jgi:hypothetical protein